MIFRNDLPLTAPAEQWIEDGVPPDAWLWHIPAGMYLVEAQARPVPDDLHRRFLQFVQWLMLESMWCQVYRLHQVSHREWQLVHDYCMELQSECLFLVPNEFTGVGFDICLGICKFDESYARYLPWMRELFSKYGFKKNPTNPLDDPRNPQYNLWADIREMRRPKEPIVKVSTGNCDQIIGLELED